MTGIMQIFAAAKTSAPTVQLSALVVAGGGGGGDRHGGGGGGGGYLINTFNAVIGSTYTVTVGSGGAGGNYETLNSTASGSGLRGTDSSIINSSTATSLIAFGGGGGGTYEGYSDQGTCGSGGGAGGAITFNVAQTGIHTPGQGNIGGNGQNPGGGGGGGAGAPGGNSVGDFGGGGGNGLQWLDGNYYAGGGGGAAQVSGNFGGTGGLGGGGKGDWDNVYGSAGTANTGGGGGGARSYTQPSIGYNGGSGIIIMRVADTITASSTTGSPTITTTGGFRYYKFTGTGTITF